METNARRLLFLVEEEGADRIVDTAAQLIPGICLSKDALRQALRNESPIRFLSYFEDDIVHGVSIRRSPNCNKHRMP